MNVEYSEIIPLRMSDCDAHGRWKLSGVLSQMQEAGESHAMRLGFSRAFLVDHGMCWVLYRLRARLDRSPQLGEKIRLTTWPGAVSGLYFPRFHRFEAENGALVGEAATTWVLFDLEKRRVLRPSALPGDLPADLTRASGLTLPGPLDVEGALPVETRTVRYTELDANGHMNNTRYADWAQDLLCAQPDAPRIRALQINYAEEGRLGDLVTLSLLRTADRALIAGHKAGAARAMFQIEAELGELSD